MSGVEAARVLIVEDDPALATALAVTVRKAGGIPRMVHSCSRAAAAMDTDTVDIIVLDLGLPDANGLDLLRRLAREKQECPPVLVISAHGDIGNRIEARRLGVVDFFDKPLNLNIFQRTLAELVEERSRGRPGVTGAAGEGFPSYIGAADSMRPVFQGIAQACASRTPVLIEGETGTGKSLTAKLIVRHGSPGNGGPEELVEEITRLDRSAQEKLVDHLETDAGAGRCLVATSTVSVWPLVRSGEFLPALYYRLQPGLIALPPLRDRLADLPALCAWFLGQTRPGVAMKLAPDAVRFLESHDWPGNLRELRNVLVLACQSVGAGVVITAHDLPSMIGPHEGTPPSDQATLAGVARYWLDERLAARPGASYRELIDSWETALLGELLRHHGGKPSRLAAVRQLNRSTLRRRLRDLGLGGKSAAKS